jgi:hypothetical protein
MQEMYAKFNEWRVTFQNNLVDPGGKLGQSRMATATPPPDGPLVEVKELVGGFMILSAANLDEAVQIARACPGLINSGSGVEVVEIFSPG